MKIWSPFVTLQKIKIQGLERISTASKKTGYNKWCLQFQSGALKMGRKLLFTRCIATKLFWSQTHIKLKKKQVIDLKQHQTCIKISQDYAYWRLGWYLNFRDYG